MSSKNKRNPRHSHPERAPDPERQGRSPSELALLILTCKGDRTGLPVLGDWLEEKLNLAVTASLVRSLDLHASTKGFRGGLAFDHFPLGEDVFLWLAEGNPNYQPKGSTMTSPCLIGLYAHPIGRPEIWGKLTIGLPWVSRSNTTQTAFLEQDAERSPLLTSVRQELIRFSAKVGP